MKLGKRFPRKPDYQIYFVYTKNTGFIVYSDT